MTVNDNGTRRLLPSRFSDEPPNDSARGHTCFGRGYSWILGSMLGA